MVQRHIIFLVHDIHFGGGGERVVTNMANYFSAKFSCSVEIISIGLPNSYPIFPVNEKVKIKYLNVDQDISNPVSNVISKFKALKRLRVYLKNNQEKSIILGIGTYPNVLLSLIGKNNLVKIGCEHNSFNSVNILWVFLRKILYKQLAATISLTEKDFINLKKISKKCFVIPNARTFSPVLNTPDRNNKQLLAIGRLSYQKGYDYLLDLFERLSKDSPDWNLRIIGDGPLKNWLISEIAKRDLQNRISLVPSSKNIADEYLNSSIYLMTSRYEGLPMVLLEAQAFGLPIISFDCDTGPSDIVIDGVNGFLVEPFDVDTMLIRTKNLIEDETLRNRFSKNALLSSDRFSEENIYSKWEQVFNELEK